MDTEFAESIVKVSAIAAGPIAGSFVGVVALRSGSASLLHPARSQCVHCGVSLSARDLVPLASWALAKGRCRLCGVPLGWFYPGVELAAVGVALWSSVTLDGWELVVACLLGWTLMTIAVIDARRMVIPDALSLPLLLAGVGLAYVETISPLSALLSAVIGYGAFALLAWGYARIRGVSGLGLGDAKLLGAAGAWVGWEGLPSVVLIAALAGLAGAVLTGGVDRDRRIPFGPALCFGFWVVWLYGPITAGAAL